MPNNTQQLKIIFFGTSDFAKIILENILNTKYLILNTVVTQPDQPVGRKKILTPPPIKILAEKHNLPVLQPEKLDENLTKKLKTLNADIFIVAAYGKIIPLSVLEIPKYKTINIHPSLLPKYRGASPIQTALLNGDKITGTTIMLVDEKMDHGNIIADCRLQIADLDNFLSLSKKLAEQSADLLIKTISDYISGKIKPKEQNHQQATFTKIIKKEDGQITADKTAQIIYNMWRAFYVWPQIFIQSTINNQQSAIKLLDIEQINLKHNHKQLQFFTQNNNLYLACASNTTLKINKLQPQGKKEMDAKSFINGYMK